MRIAAGLSALTTRPGGSTISSARNWPSLMGRSSAEVRHLNATWQQERPAVPPHPLAELDAVIVHERLRFIDAVGNLAHTRARNRLAVIHDRFHAADHGVAAV